MALLKEINAENLKVRIFETRNEMAPPPQKIFRTT